MIRTPAAAPIIQSSADEPCCRGGNVDSGEDDAAAFAVGVPQEPQKRAALGNGEPHWMQCILFLRRCVNGGRFHGSRSRDKHAGDHQRASNDHYIEAVLKLYGLQ